MAAKEFDGSYTEGRESTAAYLRENGRMELSDDQLDEIAGGLTMGSYASGPGGAPRSKRCSCGSTMVLMKDAQGYYYSCLDCGEKQPVVVA